MGYSTWTSKYPQELIYIVENSRGYSKKKTEPDSHHRCRVRKLKDHKMQQRKSPTREGVGAETDYPQPQFMELPPLERLKTHLGKFLL